MVWGFFPPRYEGADSSEALEEVIVVLNSFRSKIIKVQVCVLVIHSYGYVCISFRLCQNSAQLVMDVESLTYFNVQVQKKTEKINEDLLNDAVSEDEEWDPIRRQAGISPRLASPAHSAVRLSRKSRSPFFKPHLSHELVRQPQASPSLSASTPYLQYEDNITGWLQGWQQDNMCEALEH